MLYTLNGRIGSLGSLAGQNRSPDGIGRLGEYFSGSATVESYRGGSLGRMPRRGRISTRGLGAGDELPLVRTISTSPSADRRFGRGCDPRAMPAADEMPLVQTILDLEMQQSLAEQRCYDIPASHPSRGFCMADAAATFGSKLQIARRELAAICAHKAVVNPIRPLDVSSQPLPEETVVLDEEPLPSGAPESRTMLYVAVGGVGLLALVAGAWLLRRRRR